MSKKLYEMIEISNLKDMLNKTKNLHMDKPAYQIRSESGKYKTITHSEVRNIVDNLGTALIDIGLKNKRIAIIGMDRLFRSGSIIHSLILLLMKKRKK